MNIVESYRLDSKGSASESEPRIPEEDEETHLGMEDYDPINFDRKMYFKLA